MLICNGFLETFYINKDASLKVQNKREQAHLSAKSESALLGSRHDVIDKQKQILSATYDIQQIIRW